MNEHVIYIKISLLDEQRKSAYFEEGLKEQRQLNCSDSQQFRQEINLLTGIIIIIFNPQIYSIIFL